MTIDEAIRHAEEVAKGNEDGAKEYNRLAKLETYPSRKECESAYKTCMKCAEDHRQLATWLRDYKRLLAKESGKLRCRNCVHFEDDEAEECGRCFEYSAWEGEL